MIAMADFAPGKWLTVSEAVEYMGCSEAWVRTLLGSGQLHGAKKIGKRVWLIPETAAASAKEGLTTRATGKRHLAKRPAAKRKAAKKAARRRK
jgi:excisionase family DNA binding protein